MSNHRKVAIFWDYENCPPLNSQGHAIVNGIRRIAHVFGCVTSFKAYFDVSMQSSPKSVGFRSDLQSSGVSIIDCPHNGRKDVVDKMILVDMIAFAVDNPSPATIILIAGDRDYAYAVSTLRLRQYDVVLIVPPAPNIPQSLESQASVVVDWNFAILGKPTEADTPPVRQPYRNLDEDIVERTITRNSRFERRSCCHSPFLESSHNTSPYAACQCSRAAAAVSI
ncbi:NYN domain-containing protein [Suillus subluteus]|nr:NYN domain-containing protein [Suillus subluteus]